MYKVFFETVNDSLGEEGLDMEKRKFLVEIECDDDNNVLYDSSLEVTVEDYMEGFKITGNIKDYRVNVTEII